jgi:glyoxylase-like metal-dependent hydrolase (beta-lactamase superfamily II)
MWVLQRGGVTFHHYVAPDAGGAATSVVVELKDQLLLIDTQVAPAYARELRFYINTLPKRISRVFFSHEHPDTWSGWSEFTEFPAFAPRETEAFLQDMAPRMPARVGVRIPRLAGTIGAGDETLSGVRMQIRLVRDTEAAATATFTFPEQNTIITSDLVYQKWHLYLGNRQIERWNSVLEQVPTWVRGDALVLPGHGKPTDMRVVAELQRYLSAAQEAFASLKTADEIDAALREKFPDYGGAALLKLGISHALQRR